MNKDTDNHLHLSVSKNELITEAAGLYNGGGK